MSNKTIILWGFIIISIISAISYFGITLKNNESYIKMENILKEAVNKYIDYEEKKLPISITSEELIEKDYLKELKYDNKTCNAEVNVEKIIFWKKYKMNFTCTQNQSE